MKWYQNPKILCFAGGVAAAGYAGRKGKLASGTDILSSLNGLGEPDVLLVGGIFGVLGFLIHYCIGLLPVIGSAGPATTDLPGITVSFWRLSPVWPSARPA